MQFTLNQWDSISEVVLFQRLKGTVLGKRKSLLERGPHFMGVLREGFDLCNITETYIIIPAKQRFVHMTGKENVQQISLNYSVPHESTGKSEP